jgi:eukaryotic-like serine/threonine-protein kinase
MSANIPELYAFGPFKVDAAQGFLLRDAEPVALQRKAFEILLVLIRSGGRLVSKEELLRSVWGKTVVEESNVSQNVFVLRKALHDGEEGRHYIITVPGRGYRFGEPVTRICETTDTAIASHASAAVTAPTPTPQPERSVPQSQARGLKKVLFAASLGLFVLTLALVGYRYLRRPAALTDRDTIVLAEFENVTHDSVFDITLRQGLAAELDQSPFLNLLSDQQVASTLAMMLRPKDGRLTAELATEVCQRTGSTAMLRGTIAQLGNTYLLTLKAVNCVTGQTLASTDARAVNKDHVLEALGILATQIRSKLGESRSSVQRFAVPLESVTTASLEALQAYSLGVRDLVAQRDPEAMALFERAISIDADFAMAYLRLGTLQFNKDELTNAAANLRKAYALRLRVTERESLHIAANYAAVVTGNLEDSRKTHELWVQLYPRDWRAIENLGTIYTFLGKYEQSLSSMHTAMQLAPAAAYNYSNLVIDYLHANRLQDAQATAAEAKALHLDSPFTHANLYLVAFLQHDAAAMQREVLECLAVPGWEDLILYNESDTSAYGGRFKQAREFSIQAEEAAVKNDKQEARAAYEAEAALREALVGNFALAKDRATAAIGLSNGRDVEAMSAVAMGLSGESDKARSLATDLQKRFPEDTIVRTNSLPLISAAIAFRAGDAATAVEALAASSAYETGQTSQTVTFVMYPVYFRGAAMLQAKRGTDAAAEFQKVIDHPGLVQNEIIGSLAYLGFGRALALTGDTRRAVEAYEHFLEQWKDADAELSPLQQARAEYARISRSVK